MELNVVMVTSGIKKRQNVFVCINNATVFNNILHNKKFLSFIYIYFPYNVRFSYSVLFQLVIWVTLDITVRLYVLSLATVWAVSQYVIVQRHPVILWAGAQDMQQKLV